MEDDVQALVLEPFREITEKGNTALANASLAGHEPMQKAALGLVKEGERASKRIGPLCEKQLHDHGVAFVNALKDNNELAAFRTGLDDALYEFDDFIEADTFDADKFAALQTLSKRAALGIVEIFRRMKLDQAHYAPSSVYSTSRAPSVEPSTRPTSTADIPIIDFSIVSAALEEESHDVPETDDGPFQAMDAAIEPVAAAPKRSSTSLSTHPPELPEPEPEPQPPPKLEPKPEGEAEKVVMAAQAGPVPVWEDKLGQEPLGIATEPVIRPLFSSRIQVQSPAQGGPAEKVRLEDKPSEPPMSPWARRSATFSSFQTPLDGTVPVQRPRVPTADDYTDMVSPTISLQDSEPAFPFPARSAFRDAGIWLPPPMGSPMLVGRNGQRRLSEQTVAQRPSPRSSVFSSTNNSLHTPSIFEGQASIFEGRGDSAATSVTEPRSSSALSNVKQISPFASRDSLPSSLDSTFALPPAAFAPLPPPGYQQRDLPPLPSEAEQFGESRKGDIRAEQPGLEVVAVEYDTGLIPVFSPSYDQTLGGPLGVARQKDCSITTSSSFHQLKGFCDGAKDVIRGGIGVKRIKKPGMGAGTVIVARCKSCMYELDWKSVEADLNMSEDANYTTVGVGCRLRFLSKSHMASKNTDEQLYGCLFCVQQGRTTEESDATVFFTQRQLFAHLARHPRPLPPVPGLTVVEGNEFPEHAKNNYDLHFPNPPLRSVMEGLDPELNALPMAIATETVRGSISLQRTPPGQQVLLQFAVGAKIFGIQFPERGAGEWAVGWTDNVRGAFSLDSVRLEPPAKGEIFRDQSSMRAITRWKRSPPSKDPGDWLKFDKHEVISGISYPYPSHWCWSGYNAKGRWGIFPQAFIEPNTLRETPVMETASISSNEERRRLFPHVSLRQHRRGDSASSG